MRRELGKNVDSHPRSSLFTTVVFFRFSAVHGVFETISQPDKVAETHGQPQRQPRSQKVQMQRLRQSLQIQTPFKGKKTRILDFIDLKF